MNIDFSYVTKRPHRVLLLCILIAALAIRLYFAFTCTVASDYSDMATYNDIALKGGVSTSPPPGYPLFLRAVYAIFGERNYRAVYVAQGIIGSLTILVIYWTTGRVSNKRSGLIAAGIAAVYPNFILYSLTTLTETLGMFVAVLLVAAMTAPVSENKRSVLAAVALVLGFFIRAAFAYFWPGMLLSLRKRKVFVLATVILVFPWVLYGLVTGSGANTGARLFYKTYNPKATGNIYYELTETELGSKELSSPEYIKAALTFIKDNKWRTVDIIYNKASLILSAGWDEFVMEKIVGKNKHLVNVIFYAYLPVMVLGFIGMIRFYDVRNRIIAVPAASYLVFIVLLAVFKIRYRVLIEPMLIMYASILIGRERVPDRAGAIDSCIKA